MPSLLASKLTARNHYCTTLHHYCTPRHHYCTTLYDVTTQVDYTFLQKMIDGLDVWSDDSDTELWLNFKLGLFFALCCPKKASKPKKVHTKLADESKKVRAMDAVCRNTDACYL